MLNVITSTFCRPDLVDAMSRAVKKTCTEPVKVIVYVHPNGIVRDWSAVDEIVNGSFGGFGAWTEIPYLGNKTLIIHEDCIPMRAWSSDDFPYKDSTRTDNGPTLILRSGEEIEDPLPLKLIDVTRIISPEDCPPEWSNIANLCAKCLVESLLDNTFLHLDKGTLMFPDGDFAKSKRILLESICKHLEIEPPAPLTEQELAIHPGLKNITPPTLIRK